MGGNFENNDYQSDYFGGKLKSVANLFTFGNVDTSEKNLANQYGYHLKKRAIFGSAQIGYKSMAYLDVTARNDWSSTFKGTNTGSFFYPSIRTATEYICDNPRKTDRRIEERTGIRPFEGR